MKRKFRFLFVLVPVAFVTLGALVTMGLWNWLVPSLFGLGMIGFWQAAGILVLARILFGWRGGHHHAHLRHAYAGSSCHAHMMHRRWHSLTPEQREKLEKRWGHVHQEEPGETK